MLTRNKIATFLIIATLVGYIGIVEYFRTLDNGENEDLMGYLKEVFDTLLYLVCMTSYYISLKDRSTVLARSVLFLNTLLFLSIFASIFDLNYLNTAWGRYSSYIACLMIMMIIKLTEKWSN